MRRRDFISFAGLSCAGFLYDPSRLLWTAPSVSEGIDLSSYIIGGPYVDEEWRTYSFVGEIGALRPWSMRLERTYS